MRGNSSTPPPDQVKVFNLVENYLLLLLESNKKKLDECVTLSGVHRKKGIQGEDGVSSRGSVCHLKSYSEAARTRGREHDCCHNSDIGACLERKETERGRDELKIH